MALSSSEHSRSWQSTSSMSVSKDPANLSIGMIYPDCSCGQQNQKIQYYCIKEDCPDRLQGWLTYCKYCIRQKKHLHFPHERIDKLGMPWHLFHEEMENSFISQMRILTTSYSYLSGKEKTSLGAPTETDDVQISKEIEEITQRAKEFRDHSERMILSVDIAGLKQLEAQKDPLRQKALELVQKIE
ncbi:hypothetical protein FGO68_gene10747 [Halteria grandinella]|uniref:Uncharacterized protein n=1 Tax=Halteria grandinella TaxID=5974 RepID=A0A8J8T5E6_HALGN|nr:hypothetical protein FGO68_gene10747 [Halteria grandinella]